MPPIDNFNRDHQSRRMNELLRDKMIGDIELEVRYTSGMIGKNALDKSVMAAMRNVPRNEFVAESCLSLAFDNGPLPIGHGQTISQPYIVALMTDMLQLREEDVVLEIGTGSGYQTAVLAQLCSKVYTVECIPALADAAATRLARLGYSNIETRVGNGYHGWPEHAPYRGIMVTAAGTHVPPALIEQLEPGGRMAIPVGQPHGHQTLNLVSKDPRGKVEIHAVLGVAFVPLQGER